MNSVSHARGGTRRMVVLSTSKALLLAMLFAFVLPAVLAQAPEASAQPRRATPTTNGANAKSTAHSEAPKGFTVQKEVNGKTETHASSKAAALLFWLLAALTLGGAIFVITRRNMVTAVMGMVGTFFALAGLYAMLYGHFLAVIQVLVYAGAIMVLFVFVIMILNRPEDEPWAIQGLFGKIIAGVSLGYLLYRLIGVLWTVKDATHASEAPITPGGFEFGSTKSVGKVLFTDYLFPFEAVSIVLLVAVVGAIAIARPRTDEPNETAETSEPGEPGAAGGVA